MTAKQRVNGVVIKILYKIYQLFGYNMVYFSLYFVVFYYFIFATNVKYALTEYYSRLGIKFSYKRYYNHLFNYAVTTTDRFISQANPELYTFEYTDKPTLLKEVKQGTILLLNHFGGWATAGKCFKEDNVIINIVMNEVMIASAAAFEELLNKKHGESTKIINLSKGSLAATIDIACALTNNQSVALMGDRALDDKYLKSIVFFGKEAYFNETPFIIAYKTKRVIVSFFVILKSKKNYKIESDIIEFDFSLPQAGAIKLAMEQYVSFVSSVVSRHPLQWFNFYDFWNSTTNT